MKASIPTVYLAGPITGLSYDEGQDWRDSVSGQLSNYGIVGFSPLRAKEYLRRFDKLDSGGLKSKYLGVHPLSNPAGIVARDRNDVMTCDVVLVNLLGADKVSIGSVMEIAWADAFRTPCVVVMDEGGVHDHAMIHATVGYVTYDLETALEVVRAIINPR